MLVCTKERHKQTWIFCPDRYMIPRYTDIEQFFNINSEDGMIVTTRPLDRETQPWHNISVSATEIGGHARAHAHAHTYTEHDASEPLRDRQRCFQ